LRKRKPDIEISEECRALIAVEFEIDETAQRLPNGNWQISAHSSDCPVDL
jgi:hypothetical protein